MLPKIPIILKNVSNESSIYGPPLPLKHQKGKTLQKTCLENHRSAPDFFFFFWKFQLSKTKNENHKPTS